MPPGETFCTEIGTKFLQVQSRLGLFLSLSLVPGKKRQDWRRREPLFEFFKCYVLLSSPAELLSVSFQRFRDWLAYLREDFDESPIEVCKAKKDLNFLHRPRCLPFPY